MPAWKRAIDALRGLKHPLTARLGLLLSLFIVLMIAAYAASAWAVGQMAYDGFVLNVAGRQRALIQVYTRQVNRALVSLAISDWETLLDERSASASTARFFETTHQAFLEGGVTRFGVQLAQELRIPRTSSEVIRGRLAEVSREWRELKRVAGLALRSDAQGLKDNEYILAMQEQCTLAAAAMDSVVSCMQQDSETKLRRIEDYQAVTTGLGCFLLVGIMFFVHFRIVAPLDRTSGDLSKAKGSLLAVNEVHQALFACRSESEVARTLTDALVEKFNAYFARIWLVRPGDLCSECALAEHCGEKERCLHLMASSGHYTHLDGDHRRVPLGAFKIGLIARGRGKTISNDVANDERVHDREWAAALGLRSFAGFPLVRDGEVIGVMAMFSRHTLPAHLLESLDLLSQLGVASMANVTNLESISRAKDEVARQNAFLNTVLESLDHPFLVIDAEDHSVSLANTAARRNALPKASTCYAMTHHRDTPCDGADDPCPLEEVKKTGRPVKVEHTHYQADGSPRAVEVHAFPVFDENRRVVRVIEYSLDITDRKRAEAQLQKAKQAAEQASEALKETVEELEAFNRLAVGRELRMVELKEEVNELSKSQGLGPKYDIVDDEVTV